MIFFVNELLFIRCLYIYIFFRTESEKVYFQNELVP